MVSSILNLSPSGPRLILNVHPACLKPSLPPGASMTPSNETNSVTINLPMTSLPCLRSGLHSISIQCKSSSHQAPSDVVGMTSQNRWLYYGHAAPQVRHQ